MTENNVTSEDFAKDFDKLGIKLPAKDRNIVINLAKTNNIPIKDFYNALTAIFKSSSKVKITRDYKRKDQKAKEQLAREKKALKEASKYCINPDECLTTRNLVCDCSSMLKEALTILINAHFNEKKSILSSLNKKLCSKKFDKRTSITSKEIDELIKDLTPKKRKRKTRFDAKTYIQTSKLNKKDEGASILKAVEYRTHITKIKLKWFKTLAKRFSNLHQVDMTKTKKRQENDKNLRYYAALEILMFLYIVVFKASTKWQSLSSNYVSSKPFIVISRRYYKEVLNFLEKNYIIDINKHYFPPNLASQKDEAFCRGYVFNYQTMMTILGKENDAIDLCECPVKTYKCSSKLFKALTMHQDYVEQHGNGNGRLSCKNLMELNKNSNLFEDKVDPKFNMKDNKSFGTLVCRVAEIMKNSALQLRAHLDPEKIISAALKRASKNYKTVKYSKQKFHKIIKKAVNDCNDALDKAKAITDSTLYKSDLYSVVKQYGLTLKYENFDIPTSFQGDYCCNDDQLDKWKFKKEDYVYERYKKRKEIGRWLDGKAHDFYDSRSKHVEEFPAVSEPSCQAGFRYQDIRIKSVEAVEKYVQKHLKNDFYKLNLLLKNLEKIASTVPYETKFRVYQTYCFLDSDFRVECLTADGEDVVKVFDIPGSDIYCLPLVMLNMKFYDSEFYDKILYSVPEKDGDLGINRLFRDILALQEDAMNDIRKKLFPNKITKKGKIQKTVKTAIKKIINAKRSDNYLFASSFLNTSSKNRVDLTKLAQNNRWRINYWLISRAPLAAAFVQSHPDMWLYLCAEEKCVMNRMCNYLYNKGVTWIGKVHDAIEMKKSDAEKWGPQIEDLFIHCLGYISTQSITEWFREHGHPEYYSYIEELGVPEEEQKFYVPSTTEFLKTFEEDINVTAAKYKQFIEKEYANLCVPNKDVLLQADLKYERDKMCNLEQKAYEYNFNPKNKNKLWLSPVNLLDFNYKHLNYNYSPDASELNSNFESLTEMCKVCAKNDDRLINFKKKVDNEFDSTYYKVNHDDLALKTKRQLRAQLRFDFYECFYPESKEKYIPKELMPLF